MQISFEAHPDRYRHFKLAVDGRVATLTMDVDPHGGLRDSYELKLNSYDLGVDIELFDALTRLRFEHPEVGALVIDSALDRCFCAGANIPMLASSKHAFKVAFCKFTNETRLYLEDASQHSGLKSLAALNGTCAGGGYELALACDEIMLIDDGSSAVSLPEVPLLAVLPGTGGLTRLVDKRKVRRDRADVFCTTSEGLKGKRALQWGLVDSLAPRSRWAEAVKQRADALAAQSANEGPGITLHTIAPEREDNVLRYRHVTLAIDAEGRKALLDIKAPEGDVPSTPTAIQNAGADQWSLRAFRELDHALLELRHNYPEIGLVVLNTRGDAAKVVETDKALAANADHWLAREILLLQGRVLRRMDLTSRSFFALAGERSCFAGVLLELALASDRLYMLEDDDEEVALWTSPANDGRMRMSHDQSRLQAHFYATPEQVAVVLGHEGAIPTTEANKLGLVTVAADEIDWDDDVRVAVEERASMSPDALIGMEASLRFPGAETMESKIFARLSAWQNWIFQRPNAVGPEGALTKYGQPDRPRFDWNRC